MKDMNSGQFMLEVIVAVGVIVLISTGLVSATTASLRSNQKSRMKNEAVRYVNDGMELVRKDRDTSPSVFFEREPRDYCLGSSIDDCTIPSIPGTNYTRSVEFVANGPGKNATVTVSWTEGTDTTNTQATSIFMPWKTPSL